MILFMGGMVLLIVLAMLLPIFQLNQLIHRCRAPPSIRLRPERTWFTESAKTLLRECSVPSIYSRRNTLRRCGKLRDRSR